MSRIKKIVLADKIIDDVDVIELVTHNIIDEGLWSYERLEKQGITDFHSGLYDEVHNGELILKNKTSQQLKAFCQAVIVDASYEGVEATTGLTKAQITDRIAKI